MFLSDRVKKIPPSGIRVFFDLVMSSKGIISLGVGEPDFLTPWNIRDEAIYRLEKGYTTYTSNKGLPELRQEISKYLNRQFSIDYSSNEVLITNGVSEAVDLAMRTFINPGDEVILPEPSYVCYRPLIELCDGVTVSLDTSQSNFIPTIDDIASKITKKTKALILSFPNNPTGQSMALNDLQQIADLALEKNILIITDEIYADLSFKPFKSIATQKKIKNQLIYLNGFSKAHSMTGWRVGYVCASEAYIEAMNKIHQYSSLCAPTMSQYAAIEACKNSLNDVIKMRDSYQKRAQYFTKMMNDVGLDTIMPMGGLYCFSSIKSLGLTSLNFAEKLLKDFKVAVVPGDVFGDCGQGFFRACIATDFDQLKEAALKIHQFVKSHVK